MAFFILYTIGMTAVLAAACHLVEKSYFMMKVPGRWVWMSGIALTFLGPAGVMLSSRNASLEVAQTAAISGPPTSGSAPSIITAMPSISNRVTRSVRTTLQPLDTALSWLWLVSSVIGAVSIAAMTIRGRRLVNRATRTTFDGGSVLVSEDIGPALVGVVSYDIVVPSWFVDLPVEQKSLIIAHERQHARVFDPILIWLAAAVTVVFPWNLALWYMMRRLRTSIEIDCDQRVLQSAPDVRAYGSLLIDVSARTWARPRLAAALGETADQLQRRIIAMSPGNVPFNRVRAAFLSGGAVLLLAAATRVPQPRISIFSKPLAPQAAAQSSSPAELAEVFARRLEPEAFDESVTPGSSVIGLLFDSAGVVIHHSRLGISHLNRDLLQYQSQLFPNFKQVDTAPLAVMVRVEGTDGERHVDVWGVFLKKPSEIQQRARWEYEVSKPVIQIPGVGSPLYPPLLRKARVEGEVIAHFVVNEDGKPDATTLKILRATNDLFAASVADALPQMRFIPAQAAGKVVKQIVEQAFEFKAAK